MFELEVFRKQMYCIKESTCDNVGTFRHPRSDLASGKLCPLAPLVSPLEATSNNHLARFLSFCDGLKLDLVDGIY